MNPAITKKLLGFFMKLNNWIDGKVEIMHVLLIHFHFVNSTKTLVPMET